MGFDFEALRAKTAAGNTGLLTKSTDRLSTVPAPAPRASAPKAARKKREAASPPPPTARTTRSSRRLAAANGNGGGDETLVKLEDGLPGTTSFRDSEPKRLRREGDLELGSIAGKNGVDGLRDVFRGAQPGMPTFDPSGVVDSVTDKASKNLIKRFQKFSLYEKFPGPGKKVLPTRVYSLGFHPSEKQPIVFSGDKEGNMALVKAMPGEEAEDESYEFKQHERTISSFAVSPESHHIYSGSYDTSIRRLDTEKMKSIDIYAPGDDSHEGISCIDMLDENIIYFSTLEGRVGRVDVRTPGNQAEIWQLSDTKIGGFSLRPFDPHHVATASLDRTLRIWDLRKIKKDPDYGSRPLLVGERANRLSVSHAAWSATGTHVATSSYDDTLKIYSFGDPSLWKAGTTWDDDAMEPAASVWHNNQTGRWVSILKPHWQRRPRDRIEKFAVGNMNRFVDVYAADGTQLGQLGGDELTAVPAVAHFHPSMGWVAGGNASGKLSLWIGPDEDARWMDGE